MYKKALKYSGLVLGIFLMIASFVLSTELNFVPNAISYFSGDGEGADITYTYYTSAGEKIEYDFVNDTNSEATNEDKILSANFSSVAELAAINNNLASIASCFAFLLTFFPGLAITIVCLCIKTSDNSKIVAFFTKKRKTKA